jgi:hypothetical protein
MVQRLPELVGRAMIDAAFVEELQREPDSILAQYDLSADERATVLRALAKLARTPQGQRSQALRTELRRVAT